MCVIDVVVNLVGFVVHFVGGLFYYFGLGGYCYTGVLFVLEGIWVGAEERIWKVLEGKEYDQNIINIKIVLMKCK